MSKYPFMQVDAFTNCPLKGNPCAILFNTDDMDESTMLKIAREMNLSETAFVRQSDIADFGVRYFTPEMEIPLAGHPTIATTYSLVVSKRLKLSSDHTTISLELGIGPINVDIFAQNGIPKKIVMSQKKPRFLSIFNFEDIMPIFGLAPEDAIPDLPIQTVSTGTPQLMIPVRNIEVLRQVNMDVPLYTELRAKADFFSPHLFCLEGVTNLGTTFARHFGVPPDTREDPATGSATGGMAAYLWRYGMLEKPKFIAEQGHWMNRPSQMFIEVEGSPDNITNVKVGGEAVTVLRGEFIL